MKREPSTIFEDPKLRAEMLTLRRGGSTYKELAIKYGATTSNVVYQCRKAGLALLRETEELLVPLMEQGFSTKEIALKLNIPGTVIDFYCNRRNGKGGVVPLRRKDPLHAVVVRKDNRGVLWSSDFDGGWICMGKSKERLAKDRANQKKKELEQKRLQMLMY